MTEERKEELLLQLYEDVALCKDYLKTLSHEITTLEISNYPIFVAAQQPVSLGKLVVSKKELDIQWSFYASHLEDFVVKGIIEQDKVDEFRKLYKENAGQLCLFVLLEEEFNFIFLPYK
jgi:hypothetical protein